MYLIVKIVFDNNNSQSATVGESIIVDRDTAKKRMDFLPIVIGGSYIQTTYPTSRLTVMTTFTKIS